MGRYLISGVYMTLWSTVPSPHTRVYSALAGATTTSDLLSFLMKVSGVQTEPGGSPAAAAVSHP